MLYFSQLLTGFFLLNLAGAVLNNLYHIMRHGQSEANVECRIVSSFNKGTSGYGLSTLGVEQVLLSAEKTKRAVSF